MSNSIVIIPCSYNYIEPLQTGCSDRLVRCFLCPVSCLTHAATLFLKNAIPSHTVYDSKVTNSVLIDCSVFAYISVYCNGELYGEQ